ncbi:MAG: hypothetical protein EBW11_13245, partial [Betaproteobacteria bacterium]|nr:hypothetical protein [Betaproteobacteria bacterium]
TSGCFTTVSVSIVIAQGIESVKQSPIAIYTVSALYTNIVGIVKGITVVYNTDQTVVTYNTHHQLLVSYYTSIILEVFIVVNLIMLFFMHSQNFHIFGL